MFGAFYLKGPHYGLFLTHLEPFSSSKRLSHWVAFCTFWQLHANLQPWFTPSKYSQDFSPTLILREDPIFHRPRTILAFLIILRSKIPISIRSVNILTLEKNSRTISNSYNMGLFDVDLMCDFICKLAELIIFRSMIEVSYPMIFCK